MISIITSAISPQVYNSMKTFSFLRPKNATSLIGDDAIAGVHISVIIV